MKMRGEVMAINWFNEDNKDLVATIVESNITLNKPAKSLIDDAYSVMLGLDTEKKKAYIKALNKETVEKGLYPETQLYTVTLKSSYGRISNKGFIKSIAKMINASFNEAKKYYMLYNEDEHMLEIDLEREVL